MPGLKIMCAFLGIVQGESNLKHGFFPRCVIYNPVKFSLPECRTQNLGRLLYVL